MANQFDIDRKTFLESFPGWKCFQTFDDVSERKSRKLIYQASTDCDQYPIDGDIDFTREIIPVEIVRDLEARNNYRACISLTINETNGKGRKTTDITKVRAVWADFDGVKLPNKWDEHPSMIIETSPGRYHAYWLTVVDDEKYNVPLEAFTTIQEGIAQRFDSDKFVKDLPKAMRMPGFFHTKKEKFMVKIIDYTGKRFEFGHLVALFPPIAREKFSAPQYKKDIKFDENSEFKGDYGCGEGGRNHHIVKRIGGMKKRGLNWSEIENEAMKEAAACSPPLPEPEVRAILKSMSRY